MAAEHKELSDQDELIADRLCPGWTHRMIAETVESLDQDRRATDGGPGRLLGGLEAAPGSVRPTEWLSDKICACLRCLTPAAST